MVCLVAKAANRVIQAGQIRRNDKGPRVESLILDLRSLPRAVL
jgi:hypothetical protein